MITDIPTKHISNIPVTKNFLAFTCKMAAKNDGHRYDTKLCHCNPMYIAACTETTLSHKNDADLVAPLKDVVVDFAVEFVILHS